MPWQTKKLGDIIDFLKGKKMPVTEEQRLGYEPYIGIDTLRTREYKLFTPEKDGVKCSKDDVLVVWDGAYAGTVGIEVSGFAGSTVAKVVIREPELDSRFLRYFWELNGTKIRNAAQGAAIPHLSKPFINNLKIPLPPPATQKQIVERLDKIAEAQKLNKGLIQKADELFQSLLHQELNPVGKNIQKFGDCLTKFDRGISWSRKDEGGTIAVLRIPNIQEGQINLDDLKYIYTKNGNGELNKNDIVMVASNGNPDLVGRSALVTEREEGMRFASFLIRLKFDNTKLLSQYAHLFLLAPTFKRELRRKIATTSGIYNLKKEHIEKIKIPLPSLETQKKIAEKLSSVQNYKKQLLEQRIKLKELFDSALHKSMKREL